MCPSWSSCTHFYSLPRAAVIIIQQLGGYFFCAIVSTAASMTAYCQDDRNVFFPFFLSLSLTLSNLTPQQKRWTRRDVVPLLLEARKIGLTGLFRYVCVSVGLCGWCCCCHKISDKWSLPIGVLLSLPIVSVCLSALSIHSVLLLYFLSLGWFVRQSVCVYHFARRTDWHPFGN